MKLEELVPPWDLCKKIPAGEFKDSCYVMIGNDSIVQRADVRTVSGSEQSGIYPAPTVAEIMEEIPYSKLKRTSHAFFFERKHVTGAWSGGYNAAEAALQVYFKLKGIEY